MTKHGGIFALAALFLAGTAQPRAGEPPAGPAAPAAEPAAVSSPAAAPYAQRAGSLNLNINYPGAALRYFVADGKALELLGQGQDDVVVGGLRYYYYPARLRGAALNPYLAAEADYLSFKGSYAKGKGWGGGLYAGTEYRLNKTFSVQADLGAMYVSVKDKDSSLMESGLEFLLNLGFNIYFGGGGQ